MIRKNTSSLLALAAFALLAFDATAAAPPAGTLDPVTITAAKTRADHEAVAAAYDAEAAAAQRMAQMHEEMAVKYRDFGTKPPWNAMASHCAQLKKQYASAAQVNRDLAAEHRKIAAQLP